MLMDVKWMLKAYDMMWHDPTWCKANGAYKATYDWKASRGRGWLQRATDMCWPEMRDEIYDNIKL